MKLKHPLMLAALLLFSAPALSKDEHPGGEGQLSTAALETKCFTTTSKIVGEVCTTFKINWKMWTLMGEPVGDYHLNWKMSSIKLVNPSNGAFETYSPNSNHQWPDFVKSAADKVELYIDGHATLTSETAGRFSVFHRFTHKSEIKSTILEPNVTAQTPIAHEERWTNS